jgi:hypothetical protein
VNISGVGDQLMDLLRSELILKEQILKGRIRREIPIYSLDSELLRYSRPIGPGRLSLILVINDHPSLRFPLPVE